MKKKKNHVKYKTYENESLKKLEKKLFKIAIVLGIVAIFSAIFFIRFLLEDDLQTAKEDEMLQNISQEEALADSTYLFPDYCNLNQPIPDFNFTTESGEVLSIADFKGEITVVTFWTSWCPDCVKELAYANQFLDIVSQYGQGNYILINKLDNKKETKEQALKYLEDEEIFLKTYFDDGLVAYEALGMHKIPTTYFIDEEGILRALCYNKITDVNVFEAYVQNTIKGSGTVTGKFVEEKMMDFEGGVHSLYDIKQDKTWESPVLSESQGVMLEFSVLKENQILFNQLYNYIESKMWNEHLTAWIVENGKASDVNALIDDLRIYTSLVEANKKWGGYDETIEMYEEALKDYAIEDEHYVDFYDGDHKEYAERLTLCFGDLYAMALLAEKDSDFQKPYEEAISVVINGMISEEFPLYYSWYNYKTKTYEEEEMNTIEAMLTLYHLAEMDMLPEESIVWLNDSISNKGIAARYSVDGEVVSGYNYESTAVYALVAMIAVEVGDRDLCNEALKKMEKMRINNIDYEYNGSFGLEDGTGVNSFDQIMAMLAYEYTYSPNWD